MAANNGLAELSSASIKENFPVIQPLILKQWPSVDTNALAATAGDADKVIALIVEKTKGKKEDVSQKLVELQQRATPKKVEAEMTGGNSTQFNAVLDRLERRTQDLLKELRGNSMVQTARDRVRENLFVAILSALGLGVILGLLLGLFRSKKS